MVPVCCLGTFAKGLVHSVSIWLNIIIYIIFNLIIYIIFNLNKSTCDLLNTVEMHEASY